jgi:hypothetical protein
MLVLSEYEMIEKDHKLSVPTYPECNTLVKLIWTSGK